MRHGQGVLLGVMAHRINESGDGPHVIAIDKGETLQVSIRGIEGIGDFAKCLVEVDVLLLVASMHCQRVR